VLAGGHSPVVDADRSRRRPAVGSQDVTARASPFDIADQRSPALPANTEDITPHLRAGRREPTSVRCLIVTAFVAGAAR
jgi:hypothetical protein